MQKKTQSYQVYRNISTLLTMQGAFVKNGRRVQDSDLSIIENAVLVVKDGRFVFVGPEAALLEASRNQICLSLEASSVGANKKNKNRKKTSKRTNLKSKVLKGRFVFFNWSGKTVLPGFLDCHTHLVFAGSRASEFEMRLRGKSYQEISAEGGGILSTVRATRAAPFTELYRLAALRAEQFLKQGVTTLEIKSGYGLNKASEIKILRVIKKLKARARGQFLATFLGAHALPPEFKTAGERAYLNYLLKEVLPEIKKQNLAERVDIFVEKGFFGLEEAKFYFKKLKKMGFALTVHADQLSLSGGLDLALELKAASADHLIFTEPDAIKRLARSEVTAVHLPNADLYMKCAYPPSRILLDEGARVALSTDFNPGSSPSMDIQLVGLLARLKMQMTFAEVLNGFTVAPSFALGLEGKKGVIQRGADADFLVAEKPYQELFYQPGSFWPEQVYFGGSKLIDNQ